MGHGNDQPNRLIDEQSPYLLQHAYNPVDWHPWGEGAFEKAGRENKPVFLSVGYATCHWCHVMAHESFEDPEAADLINQNFVPVKVDREERPDIDTVYMKVCQMITGRGGWPLTVFLTPDKKPFFAATYIPRQGRFPQTGLMELIPRMREIWTTQPEKVRQSASEVLQHLQRAEGDTRGGFPEPSLLDRAAGAYRDTFDPENGGFGSAPKFPSPHNFLFLLAHYRRKQEPQSLDMVETTLRAMRRGGIFDHLGYGFHRYSTDREWLVPHFEKMLYDQAMLALAYLETHQATGDELYAATAREIFTYVLRDLRSGEGVFCSGEDADSEGVEGKHYVWSEAEIRELLTSEEAEAVIGIYNVRQQGNFRDEATRELTGANILHRLQGDPARIAQGLGLSPEGLRELLDRAESKLLAAREKRVRPLLDDKILTDWNGLMIAALARGGSTLSEPGYTEAAERAARFLLQTMRNERGELLHRYRGGESGIQAFLDDYAFLAWGLLELAAATGNAEYRREAKGLTDAMLEHFWDRERGGLFFTADNAETLLIRPKDLFDGAIPSGNSAALYDMLRLIREGEDGSLSRLSREQVQAFSGTVQNIPTGFSFYLCGLDLAYDVLDQGGGPR
jgi:hypothetical protein